MPPRILPPLRLFAIQSSTRCFSSSLSSLSHANPLGLPTNRPAPPTMPRMGGGLPKKSKIPGVKKVVVVASGKGGVGKSTVAVNLALALLLEHPGKRVGLLDLDVFGPSVPRLMGLDGEPELTQGGRLIPLENHGIGTMSMGYLVPQSATGENPIVWRGMMVMKAVQQLLFDVDWTSSASASSSSSTKGEDLDVLVIDMPPGTGDVALSLGQLVIVDGAVIVSTPQEIALIDARKGVGLFKKLNIPILGLLLNMSHLPTSPPLYPFGSSAAFRRAASELDASILGEVPIVEGLSAGGDEGKPLLISPPRNGEGSGPEEEVRRVFRGVAQLVWRKIS